MRSYADRMREEGQAILDAADAADRAAAKMSSTFNKIGEDISMTDEELAKWGELWANNKDQIEAAGFTYNQETGQIQMDASKEQDWGALYSLLSEQGVSQWGVYGEQMMSYLEGIGADSVAATQTARANSEMMQRLYSERDANGVNILDPLNTRHEERSLRDVRDLARAAGADNAQSQSYLASQISGYEHWAGASQQYEAVVQLATNVQSMTVNSDLSQQDVQDAILDAILDKGVNGGQQIDIDTMLYIHPSAIVVTADGDVEIDENTLKLAQAQADKAKIEDRKSKRESVQKIDKGGTLSYDDYTALQATGYFTDEELDSYVRQSPEARALMLQEQEQQEINDRLESNRQIVEEGKQRSAELRAELESYYTNLRNVFGLRDENGELLQGEDLYRKISW